jgi:putative salt-induced outer membrane protein YdiY
MERLMKCVLPVLVLLAAGAAAASAQTPAQPPPPATATPTVPPPPWTGSIAFGLSLNRGNTDTTNFNLSGDATYDPKTDDVCRFKGLYLRGDNNGTLAVDRFDMLGRYEHTFTGRVYGFVQVQFLKDHFKQIDYLWAPTFGVGYKLIATPQTTFRGLGAHLGVEQDAIPALDTAPASTVVHGSVVSASDKFEYQISDLEDHRAFSAFGTRTTLATPSACSPGSLAAMTTRTQLKAELLDTNQTRPPSQGVKNNDVALITALVYKF